jgi:hypothetical protein
MRFTSASHIQERVREEAANELILHIELANQQASQPASFRVAIFGELHERNA